MRAVFPSDRSLPVLHPDPSPTHAEGVRAPSAPSPASFSEVMRGLVTRLDRGEAAVHSALGGRALSDDGRGMIALQAGVYRYVESVELLTRLVDRATNAARVVLQNQ